MSSSFLYFGIYTLFLVVIWGFFIITRIHALKFKNFQTKIITSLKTLCILLLFLSISGFIVLYMIINSGTTFKVDKLEKVETIEDINETINNLQEEIY